MIRFNISLCGGSADGGRVFLSLIGQVGWKVDKGGLFISAREEAGERGWCRLGGGYDGRDKGQRYWPLRPPRASIQSSRWLNDRNIWSIKVEERGPCLSYFKGHFDRFTKMWSGSVCTVCVSHLLKSNQGQPRLRLLV